MGRLITQTQGIGSGCDIRGIPALHDEVASVSIRKHPAPYAGTEDLHNA